jgi:hypothetical protein
MDDRMPGQGPEKRPQRLALFVAGGIAFFMIAAFPSALLISARPFQPSDPLGDIPCLYWLLLGLSLLVFLGLIILPASNGAVARNKMKDG